MGRGRKEHVRVMVCSGGLGYRGNTYLSKLSKFTLKICAFLLTLREKRIGAFLCQFYNKRKIINWISVSNIEVWNLL